MQEFPNLPEALVLNEERIESLSGGDKELETAFFDAYYEETSGLIASLKKAAGEGDFATCRTYAHSIKGSSANLGADQLAELARSMEIAIDEGSSPDEIVAYSALIESAFMTFQSVARERIA